MRTWRALLGSGTVALLLIVAWGTIVHQASAQPDPAGVGRSDRALAYQLLTNPGMEVYDPPYAQFRGADCQVASGWQRFWYGGPEPYWMDTRVFANTLGSGWVEKIEGETSQLVLATEPYTAGLQQQVAGLVPGIGYGFHAAMLTIFQTSAQDPVHNTMIKQVGMDPTGSTDPQAPTVVWSEPDPHDQAFWSIDLRAAAFAQAPTMTVFIRVESLYPSGDESLLNLSFLDSAILARTAYVSATTTPVVAETAFPVRWNNAVPSPDAEIRWYDVEWLDEAEGVWQQWFTKTKDLAATFSGQRGHAYRFRARAWQRYPNGAHLTSPYRAEGDTRTFILGPQLTGLVTNRDGQPVYGATVAISGTDYAVSTAADGRYAMDVEAWTEPQTATVSHPTLPAPAPVYGLTIGPTETLTLTWTLRPPQDAVANGEFEAGLDGWTLAGTETSTPTVVTEPVHSGLGALALGEATTASPAAAAVSTTGVTQTVVLTRAWEPVLSFWYRPAITATGDLFNVALTVVTRTLSPTLPVTTTYVYTPPLDAGGWHYVRYPAGPPESALTGTVTIHLLLSDDGAGGATAVYLDEVGLGATYGGPFKAYLPLALKEH